ncbi:MAG TPA: hypothetical protein VFS63_04660 [Pseudolabrys sp.]|jgi:hypothetical protein|nr:hypothetical protein [Pseudolabrys sp.]
MSIKLHSFFPVAAPETVSHEPDDIRAVRRERILTVIATVAAVVIVAAVAVLMGMA